jgi:hypothetical protein
MLLPGYCPRVTRAAKAHRMTTQPVDALLARQSALAPQPITSAPESPPAPRWNPGDLVLEPGCPVPSVVIRRLDDPTVLLHHVGLWDDHVIAAADLRAFVDGCRVRCGTDYGDSH